VAKTPRARIVGGKGRGKTHTLAWKVVRLHKTRGGHEERRLQVTRETTVGETTGKGRENHRGWKRMGRRIFWTGARGGVVQLKAKNKKRKTSGKERGGRRNLRKGRDVLKESF